MLKNGTWSEAEHADSAILCGDEWIFFPDRTVKNITGATPVAADGTTTVAVAEPGTGVVFEVTPVQGAPFRILTLTRQQAEHSFKADDLWGARVWFCPTTM